MCVSVTMSGEITSQPLAAAASAQASSSTSSGDPGATNVQVMLHSFHVVVTLHAQRITDQCTSTVRSFAARPAAAGPGNLPRGQCTASQATLFGFAGTFDSSFTRWYAASSINRSRSSSRPCGARNDPPCSFAADLWSAGGSGSKSSPRGGGRRPRGAAAENIIILNSHGREQLLDVPQSTSSASRREQHGTEMAPGRSLVCDRLRDRVCVIGRVRVRFAVQTLRTRDDALDGVRHAPWIDRDEV